MLEFVAIYYTTTATNTTSAGTMQWYAQNPLHTFPHNFPVDGEVASLLAPSHCNGIWEKSRHNRHNGLSPVPSCYGLVVYVADLLRRSRQLVTDLVRGNWCSAFWHLL